MNDELERLFADHEYVKMKEIAAYFRISPLTVRRKMRKNGIPGIRPGGIHLLTREQVKGLFPEQE